jgi:hypothetical protein
VGENRGFLLYKQVKRNFKKLHMKNDFYNKYKTFSKNQIFDIVINKDDYQTDAVDAVILIVKENNWESEINDKIKKLNQDYENEIAEKAEYYNRVVEFQRDNFCFNIRISDIPRFESVLVKKNIDFLREDKNIGVQLDSYPTQKYYFKEKDIKKVDEICISLKLITQPYADIKPFIKFELKVILIAVIVALLFYLIFIR